MAGFKGERNPSGRVCSALLVRDLYSILHKIKQLATLMAFTTFNEMALLN